MSIPSEYKPKFIKGLPPEHLCTALLWLADKDGFLTVHKLQRPDRHAEWPLPAGYDLSSIAAWAPFSPSAGEPVRFVDTCGPSEWPAGFASA